MSRNITKRELATIRSLKSEVASLVDRNDVQSRVIQVASRDADRAFTFAKAVCAMADAAYNLTRCGLGDYAEALLRSVISAEIDFMRNAVSRGPGGVNHKPTAPPSGDLK
jgi:hypothetical protein